MKDLLDLLKTEKEQEQNEFKVEHNSQIKLMARGLKKACYWYDLLYNTHEMRNKNSDEKRYFINRLCFINAPEALDIDYICPNEFVSIDLLKKSAPYNIDTFISEYVTALANCTKKEKVLINLTKMDELIGHGERLDYLCHDNEKEIIILGDIGHNLGANMIDGIITVNGDARYVGVGMKKGVININCKPGKKRFELINGWPEGDIYYNGKLILKEGKRIKFEGDNKDDDCY